MKITDTTAPGDVRTITLPSGSSREECVTHVIHDGDDVYVGTRVLADFPCPECGRRECPKAWDVRNTCGDGDASRGFAGAYNLSTERFLP